MRCIRYSDAFNRGADECRERTRGIRIPAPATREARKWHYVYFLLAAFDLVTVSGGPYLNYRIMDIFTRSVEVNRVWAERISAYSHLGELAADVDAPGNDIFDNRNVDQEFLRMQDAEQAFDLDLAQRRREMQANLDSKVALPLLALLDAIAVAKTEMVDEAARIFGYFRKIGRIWRASAWQRWTTNTQTLNAALLQLRRAVGAIQEQHFNAQTAAAAALQRYGT